MADSRVPNAVLKKWNWATGQTLTPIGLERGFPEEHRGRKDVKNRDHGCP